jgi:hypothetical protein
VLGVLVCLLVLTLQAMTVYANYDGNWTALFYTGELSRVPPALELGTWIFPGIRGYDGQMYRYISRAPLLDGPLPQYVDDARLRYRRILLPGVAALFGPWSDAALIGLVILFAGAGVYWTARIFALYGRHPAWGLLFLAMPATLASVQRTLIDGALLAFVAAFILYVETGRWGRVFAVCTLAVLTRETGVLLTAGAVAHLLLDRRWRLAAGMAASALPALAWSVYVWSRTPPSTATEIFGLPLIGLVQRLFVVRPVADPITYWLLRITDPIAVAGLLAAIVLGVITVSKLRTVAVKVAVGLYVLLAAVLTSPAHLEDPVGFARPVTPLLLVLTIEGVLRRSVLLLVPALCVALAVSIYYISPGWGIVKAATALLR